MAEKSSYATYLVEGLNTEKNLNFLCGNGICLYEVKKINKKQYFVTVPFKERKKLIALLKNRCYNIKLIKKRRLFGIFGKNQNALRASDACVRGFLRSVRRKPFRVGHRGERRRGRGGGACRARRKGHKKGLSAVADKHRRNGKFPFLAHRKQYVLSA